MSSPSDLFERERETAEIDAALADARAGRGRLEIVQGAAGLGKTSLLERACEDARAAGMRVLVARGSELEASFAFGVVRQLFEGLYHGADEAQREAWLAGAAGLTRPMFDHDAVEADDGADATYPRLHGLYWLTVNVAADGPLVLCVDDAHWSDEPSLRFLSFLSRRIEDVPVLLLVGTRPAADAISPVLPLLLAESGARVTGLSALSDEAVATWLEHAYAGAAEREFADACHDVTSGNPLLIRELLREIDSERIAPTREQAERVARLGPRGVSSVVLLRLARLPPTAPALARAVAVLGESARLGTAAPLAGLDAETAAHTADALVRAEILTPSDRLTFVHPIVRAAIYEDIPPAERAGHHASAARVLADGGCPHEEIAAQLLEAPAADEAWAVDVLRGVARHALTLGDCGVAVTYLRRALEEPPPPGELPAVLADLGRAEARTGAPEAVDHLEQAIATSTDPVQSTEASLELAALLKFAGRSVRAVDVLKAAAAQLGDADPGLAERLDVELIGSAMISMQARPLLADDLDRLLRDPGGTPTTFLERAALSGLAFNGFASGRPADEVADLAQRALGGGDLPTDPVAGGHSFISAVIALMFAERYGEAHAHYSAAIADARRRGSAVSFANASSLRSLVNYRRGRLAEAHADATAALDLADEVEGSQGFLAAALGTLIYTSMDRGEVTEELEERADRFLVEQATDNLPYSHAIHSRAMLRVERGDLQRALSELLASGERELEWGARNPAITPWRSSAAIVHARLGDHDEARRLAAEEVELARGFGAPRCLGRALRVSGLVEEGPAGEERLREALAVLDGSEGALELARTLFDLGELRRAAGERDDARDLLRRAQDLAARCGATRLEDRAGEALRATGARPRRVAVTGVDSLTPTERRVAGMAARGMTNRDIAQALFVTQKTVENHLGQVYAKLEVRSRRQLPDMLAPPA